MVPQLLQGRSRGLDRTNRTIRKQISEQADALEFSALWLTGHNLVSSSVLNPVHIANQGVGFDVIDNIGTNHGRGQQIVAKGGNAIYAVVSVADSLNDLESQRAEAVTAAVQNALKLSASSDPGCVYIVVP